jgi:hypothetical protein
MRGILYWNSHAFNLTDEDHPLNGRLNFTFAKDQRYPVRPIFESRYVFAANAAPYTSQTVCGEHVLPQGARLFAITSHTHKRGKLFQAWAPDGTQIYENAIYNDPVKQGFEPPLAFDAESPAERTIRYCALYENGIDADGSPNPETVTRASRVPESARRTIGGCKPVACVAGKRFPQPDDDLLVGGLASEGASRHDPDGRSLFIGMAAPPALGCGTSPGAHAPGGGDPP